MKRQATKALLLCGSVLSMAIGCSKGDDSELAGGPTVNCEQVASVALTGSTPDLSTPFGLNLGYTPGASNGNSTDSGICFSKSGKRMNSSGQLVDSSNKVVFTDGKPVAVNEPCYTFANGDITPASEQDEARRDREATAAATAQTRRDREATAAATTAQTYGKAPNHRCTITRTGSVEDKLNSTNPSQKQTPLSVPVGAASSVPAAAPVGPPSAADLNTLMTTARAGQSTGPATSSGSNARARQPATGGTTEGGLDSSESQIKGTGPGFSGNGNTSFSLTDKK